MGRINIIKPGLLTTIQDLGRFDFQIYGISSSGAMDSMSLRIANILVGNKENEGGIEATLIGPKLEFKTNSVISITGGDFAPTINGNPVDLWRTLHVHKGDILNFKGRKNGCRTYIAIQGGIDVPEVMNSKSTFLRGGFGGFKGRKLEKGDNLRIDRKNIKKNHKKRKLSSRFIPKFGTKDRIRVILGPDADYFSEKSINKLFTAPYTILKDSDRMGYRLEGPLLEHKNGADIITNYVPSGTIQVPGNEQPIVLMSDSQVTGGYTRIGTVIETDLPYLAQKSPGEDIIFEKINLSKAQHLWKKRELFFTLLNFNNELN